MNEAAYRSKHEEWKAVRRAIREIVEGGAASASISTGTGSKAYTRLDLCLLRRMEQDLRADLWAIESGTHCARIPKTVTVRFS